ncbi:PIN domain-containing protein [Roseateles sp. GG27B]
MLRHYPLATTAFQLLEIELLSFSGLSAADEQKIHELLTLLDRVELTQSVRLEAIQLRKQKKLKLPDAIIAASAITRNATLLTNDQAFHITSGLSVESLKITPQN